MCTWVEPTATWPVYARHERSCRCNEPDCSIASMARTPAGMAFLAVMAVCASAVELSEEQHEKLPDFGNPQVPPVPCRGLRVVRGAHATLHSLSTPPRPGRRWRADYGAARAAAAPSSTTQHCQVNRVQGSCIARRGRVQPAGIRGR